MFTIPTLPYAYNALEPYIDARTMEIHHTKHHNAYTTNLNAALAPAGVEGKSIEEILTNLDMSCSYSFWLGLGVALCTQRRQSRNLLYCKSR